MQFVDRELAIGKHIQHLATDVAGCANDCDLEAHECGVLGLRLERRSNAPRSFNELAGDLPVRPCRFKALGLNAACRWRRRRGQLPAAGLFCQFSLPK
jgi:hypothetical protein